MDGELEEKQGRGKERCLQGWDANLCLVTSYPVHADPLSPGVSFTGTRLFCHIKVFKYSVLLFVLKHIRSAPSESSRRRTVWVSDEYFTLAVLTALICENSLE